MKIRHASILLAAMLAGGAFAATDYGTNYSAAAETSDSPLRAGEMSTMTNGAPNVQTTNSPYGDRSGANGHQANRALTASQTSDTPIRAGEMSTMTNGAPNVATNNMVESVDTASMTLDSTTAMGAGPVYIAPAPIYVVPSN
jgi:hypothetical protein